MSDSQGQPQEASGLDQAWAEAHPGMVRFTAWLSALARSGASTLPCGQCGAEVERFSVVGQDRFLCGACHPPAGGEASQYTVRTLFKSFGESLILLRNFNLFLLGLQVVREETVLMVPGNAVPAQMLEILAGKQSALMEARQVWLLINQMAQSAQGRGMPLPTNSPEVNQNRVKDLLRFA